MSWISMATLTAQLPSESGLRGAAYRLRDTGDRLAGQASVTRGAADSAGPAVWSDRTSDRARALLHEVADELATGGAALHQSADALDQLAGYVAGQRSRYEEAGRELEALVRDVYGDIAHGKLGDATRLVEERVSIEWNVRYAMGQAADEINQAAARATRYHTGIWSRIEHDVADFVSGIVDGAVGIVKGIGETAWSLAVLAVKLSPERMLIDPQGYLRDLRHAEATLVSTISAVSHHPKQFVETVLNLHELGKDPAHWLGELVPNLVLLLATDGAGIVAKGADGVDAAEATALAARGADLPALRGDAIEHIINGVLNADEKSGVGFHSAPGGVAPAGRRIISTGLENSDGSWMARVQFLNSSGKWVPPGGKFSTMFPKAWSHDDTVHAVQEAFQNRYIVRDTGHGVYWQGEYDGVQIGGWLGGDALPDTAYPVQNPIYTKLGKTALSSPVD